MLEPALNLSPQQFAAAFPFHVVLDGQLRVRQLGSVLRRLCPGMAEGEAPSWISAVSVSALKPRIFMPWKSAGVSSGFLPEV